MKSNEFRYPGPWVYYLAVPIIARIESLIKRNSTLNYALVADGHPRRLVYYRNGRKVASF